MYKLLHKTTLFLFVAFMLLAIPVSTYARSGCCSYHQGVRADGCGCNDGSPLSNTCAPYYSCNAAPQEAAPTTYVQPTYIPPTAIPTLIPTNTPMQMPTPTKVITSTVPLVPTKSMKIEKKKVEKIIKHQAPKQKGFWEWLFSR